MFLFRWKSWWRFLFFILFAIDYSSFYLRPALNNHFHTPPFDFSIPARQSMPTWLSHQLSARDLIGKSVQVMTLDRSRAEHTYTLTYWSSMTVCFSSFSFSITTTATIERATRSLNYCESVGQIICLKRNLDTFPLFFLFNERENMFYENTLLWEKKKNKNITRLDINIRSIP